MSGVRPYVLASCAVSVDGYLDDASETRLVLSNDDDLDRVDEVRAGCDAILVGADTIRRDDPRLLVRSDIRRQRRVEAGRQPHPLKVALTATGDLDPAARFFSTGSTAPTDKIVYVATPMVTQARDRLGSVARVVDAGDPLDLHRIVADLADRGVRRLMVEGGGRTLTAFFTADLVDELHLVVAPFFVGEETAPRFVRGGRFPHDLTAPMRLAEARPIGNCVLLRYLLGADRFWLQAAIELSRRSPQSSSAYAVGAILVDAAGHEIARGYSRETDARAHAEEVALARVAGSDPRLRDATLYSSLEPCSTRASRRRPCAELVVEAGIRRVVIAWREPDHFVDGRGVELLTAAGVEVVEVPDLAAAARSVNSHLFDQDG